MKYMTWIESNDFSYWKVIYGGGCVVRAEPTLTARATGRIVCPDSVIPTKTVVTADGNTFIEINDGEWVVAQKGSEMQVCVRQDDGSAKADVKYMSNKEASMLSVLGRLLVGKCMTAQEPHVPAEMYSEQKQQPRPDSEYDEEKRGDDVSVAMTVKSRMTARPGATAAETAAEAAAETAAETAATPASSPHHVSDVPMDGQSVITTLSATTFASRRELFPVPGKVWVPAPPPPPLDPPPELQQ
jgi:hypothetical protein